ncbi:glycoside hydrolase family 31 protein [Bifidobacterium subtile]|uniref:Glycosyl hydrolases family 31, Alpha-glucosidase or alpha-xylosidase n=1 Tax=Bifidobacterium subtile TaxID=77635 RepID=A0A087E7B4_9BIFI|nr:glycoside hydrolase family 31 protein [Bifidobacterium subtile]KFJ03665.1 Glycosyl hydrolases family 31, Alpha-glucosidase or alpha-xylosidase [Bifidobacterium subtile]QOL36250.1 alpha-glucosidase [Bifidobacterium subtile]
MTHFPQLDTHPIMNPEAVIQGDHWRIGVLAESLIRVEWQDDGVFEDHATQMVVNRDWGAKPHFTHTVRDGRLVLDTPALRLTYDMKPFSKEGLSVVIKGVNSNRNTWNYGEEQEGNLRGTARTLDETNGVTPLGLGVVSRDGWAVLDDSASNILAETEQVNGEANPFGTWVVPRPGEGHDLYVFGYAHRYIEAIRDFYRLTGPTPLLPRFALGNWWSRYHRYTEREYLQLVERFEHEGLPFTTAVIDMDWHLVDAVDPKYGSGWTGYTWNRSFFPDPKRFLDTLHRHGLKITPNVHPRDGIRAFEDGYAEAARQLGIDPASEEPIEFDLTSPKFMKTYFDLHHRLEDEGIDFWWLDWQQGGVTRQQGLDPLWMLNHLHYLDSGRDGRWPLTFSRYAGPGSHRYPVGFSGDTVVSWESLRFQPYFTATASNIGYGWWSHDIGGHMFGRRDEELEARWYQLGAFSPINRLHSTDSAFNGKEPWNFRAEVRDSMNASLRLRHELIPYLYTMNWRAAIKDRPIVEPMYWQAADNASAYEVPNEFRFGTELVVAPIVEPIDREAQLAKTDVWLPQGTWFDFFTGRRYEAPGIDGRKLEVWRPLEAMPVFAKAGGIVPMQPLDEANGPVNSIDNPKHVRVVAFAGADGSFTLVEDDGSRGTESAVSTTEMALHWVAGSSATFTIGAAQGEAEADGSVVPERRAWTVVMRGVEPAKVSVRVGGEAIEATTAYDERTLSLSVEIPEVSSACAVEILFDGELALAHDTSADDAFRVLYNAQIDYLTKDKADRLVRSDGPAALNALHTLEEPANGDHRHDLFVSHMPESVIRAVAEQLLRV